MSKQHAGWTSPRQGTEQSSGFKKSTSNNATKVMRVPSPANQSSAGGHFTPGAGQLGSKGFVGIKDSGNPKA